MALWVVDGGRVAADAGLDGHINTVLQTCGVCVTVCPAKNKEVVKHKAINMEPKDDHLDVGRLNFAHFAVPGMRGALPASGNQPAEVVDE